MSNSEEVEIVRPANDTAREVRIIRALYPQECLHPNLQYSCTPQLGEPQESWRTYQNTGAQTLPPPNGKIYKLIYGHEPSQTDYRCNMGVAAIGRYEQDPRSNPFALMYGAVYTAPPAMRKAAYIDSGFQTANHDTSKMALAKSKAKTSMTANKYRGAAARAGYVIYMESRDERIVHSEQYPTTVRLDPEGNLLDGHIKGRYLPNISGITPWPDQFVAQSYQRRSASAIEAMSSASLGSTDALTHNISYQSPPQPLTIGPQSLMDEVTMSSVKISALEPSSNAQSSDLDPHLDDEYGYVGSDTRHLVVYDAEAAPAPSIYSSTGKRNLSEVQRVESPPKRARTSTPEALLRSPSSIISSSRSRNHLPHQDRDLPARQSELICETRPRSTQRRRVSSYYVDQERDLRVNQSTTKTRRSTAVCNSSEYRKLTSEAPFSSKSTSTSGASRNEAVRQETGSQQALDSNHQRSSVCVQARKLPSERSDPGYSVTTAVPVVQDAQSSRGSRGVSSPQRGPSLVSRRRSGDRTHYFADDDELYDKRNKFDSVIQEQDINTQARKSIPRSRRGISPNGTRAPCADGWSQERNAVARSNRTASGRIEKTNAPRTPRGPRQEFMQYLPPAMRARAWQDSNGNRGRK